MTPEERASELDRTLDALRSVWPVLQPTLLARANDLTLSLIGENNEQVRGRLKELRALMDLPETLHQEREGIRAALAE